MMTLDDTYFMKQALIEAGKAAERVVQTERRASVRVCMCV